MNALYSNVVLCGLKSLPAKLTDNNKTWWNKAKYEKHPSPEEDSTVIM
jgi:hypothetical protein